MAFADAPRDPAPASPDAPARASAPEYRIEELARLAGTTVRNVRAYRDRGLLPAPRREGRVALYNDGHVGRLSLITDLLDRGYSLANIAELLEAWERGKDVGELIGFEAALAGPWTTEHSGVTDLDDLVARFGRQATPEFVARSERLGILEPEVDRGGDPTGRWTVRSPVLLDAGTDLARAGVPVPEILDHGEQLHRQLDQLAGNFVGLVSRHIFDLADDSPKPGEVAHLADLVNQLRPLAQRVVMAEFARAMERHVHARLGERIKEMLAELDAPSRTEAS